MSNAKRGRAAWALHISADAGTSEADKIILKRTGRGRQITLAIDASGMWSMAPAQDQIRLIRTEIQTALDELRATIDAAKPQGETIFLVLDRADRRIRLEIEEPGLQSAEADQNRRTRQKTQAALAALRRALESPSALPGLHQP